MKIAVINTLPVPSGEASVNRLLSYTKGLVKQGNNVTILSSANGNPQSGNIHGVAYHNYGLFGSKLISLLKALIRILKCLCKEKYDVVILVSNSLLLIYPVVIACHLHGIKVLQEKSEFPFILNKKGALWKVMAKFYVNTTYRLFDGLIVMTKPLMTYFKDKIRKKASLFEMPMTVDVERFDIKKDNNPTYGEYIAYCGNMSGNKDGVQNLIEAFSLVTEELPAIRLLLIGGTNKPVELEIFKQQVKERGLERIVFYGKANREEIPSLLVNAKLLALARPSSLQSTGGFPTKLGEYLATGNPVIVTAVGDIPQYLNNSNAYVVPPDDISEFAKAIKDVFKNYEKAQERGKEGKKIARSVFNSKVQSERLNHYLQLIV